MRKRGWGLAGSAFDLFNPLIRGCLQRKFLKIKMYIGLKGGKYDKNEFQKKKKNFRCIFSSPANPIPSLKRVKFGWIPGYFEGFAGDELTELHLFFSCEHPPYNLYFNLKLYTFPFFLFLGETFTLFITLLSSTIKRFTVVKLFIMVV